MPGVGGRDEEAMLAMVVFMDGGAGAKLGGELADDGVETAGDAIFS